jgi:hypothetical protein
VTISPGVTASRPAARAISFSASVFFITQIPDFQPVSRRPDGVRYAHGSTAASAL